MHVEFTCLIERWRQVSPVSLAERRASKIKARAIEGAGFSRIEIADPAGLPDNAALASFLLASTRSLHIRLPHRAGLVDPVGAAHELARLDRMGDGRLSMRLVSGNDVAVSGGERPFDHEAEMARLDEYLVLLKRLWVNSQPFDHEGPFYSVRHGFLSAKPLSHVIPLVLAGNTGTAVKVAARHADVFALPAAGAAETSQTVARARAAALSFGRADRIRFSLDIWPVLPGSDAARESRAAATQFGGRPKSMARKLLAFRDAGVSEFVVHGLETEQDIGAFGRCVIPLIRRAWQGMPHPSTRQLPGISAGRGA